MKGIIMKKIVTTVAVAVPVIGFWLFVAPVGCAASIAAGDAGILGLFMVGFIVAIGSFYLVKKM